MSIAQALRNLVTAAVAPALDALAARVTAVESRVLTDTERALLAELAALTNTEQTLGESAITLPEIEA